MAAQTLRFSPVLLEASAAAGETIEQSFTVTAVDAGFTVVPVHADFGFDDASYTPQLIEDDAEQTTSFSTRGWFHFDRARYVVPPHGSATISMKITVPANTPGGTYLGAALAQMVPDDAQPGSGSVAVSQRGGPLVFLRVAGGSPPRARVRQFGLPRIALGGPITPSITVENVGDEYFTYTGTVTLRGHGMHDSVQLPRKFVVPGTPRRVLARGRGDGEDVTPRLGRGRLWPGRYELVSRLRIEPTGATIITTRHVWVIPVWTWLAAGAVLFALLSGGGWLVRRRRGRDVS